MQKTRKYPKQYSVVDYFLCISTDCLGKGKHSLRIRSADWGNTSKYRAVIFNVGLVTKLQNCQYLAIQNIKAREKNF